MEKNSESVIYLVKVIEMNFQQTQWIKNNGSCGPCGDDFSLRRPRPHENGGIFSDITFRTMFRQMQSVRINIIATSLILNADIVFDLCHLKDLNSVETEECFAEYKLSYTTAPDGQVAHVGAKNRNGTHNFFVTLPISKMTRGVLRMTAVTGIICCDKIRKSSDTVTHILYVIYFQEKILDYVPTDK